MRLNTRREERQSSPQIKAKEEECTHIPLRELYQLPKRPFQHHVHLFAFAVHLLDPLQGVMVQQDHVLPILLPLPHCTQHFIGLIHVLVYDILDVETPGRWLPFLASQLATGEVDGGIVVCGRPASCWEGIGVH